MKSRQSKVARSSGCLLLAVHSGSALAKPRNAFPQASYALTSGRDTVGSRLRHGCIRA
jgi:hypothetical protein